VVYYVASDEIGFSDALVTWSMFYFRRTLIDPHEKITEQIKNFIGKKVLKGQGI
jgi:hypothetical protein